MILMIKAPVLDAEFRVRGFGFKICDVGLRAHFPGGGGGGRGRREGSLLPEPRLKLRAIVNHSIRQHAIPLIASEQQPPTAMSRSSRGVFATWWLIKCSEDSPSSTTCFYQTECCHRNPRLCGHCSSVAQ